MQLLSDVCDAHRPNVKILVVDDDPASANTLAAVLPTRFVEVISCRDMALAEVATDMTHFDLILLAPSSTGLDGLDGLAAADFLTVRNPMALTALLVPEEDADIQAAVQRRGVFPVISKPFSRNELLPVLAELGWQPEDCHAA